MRDFGCPTCGQRLAFDNSVCLGCGGALGFSLDDMALLVIPPGYQLCANLHLAECNWLVPVGSSPGLCSSCALTRTRPADTDGKAMAAFAEAEKAKRRMLVECCELDLPIIGRDRDPQRGLAFDLLSSEWDQVVTGHHDGIITLDMAEGDDVHREQLRVEMDEPYRTLLGHFRHEIGHYYFYRLIGVSPEHLGRFRALFGDPDADYRAALDRHYENGPPADWEQSFVSSYATMHPAEDWAETFAHYLHIRDTLDTAAAFGFAPADAALARRDAAFDALIEWWLPLAWALNMVNRSMGKADLYPFVLPPPVLEKMRFIHGAIENGAIADGT